ncbi:MAG: hypothetical protein HC904_01650 [Blastochloris sp.]|nr:hypothetical protein [Blastochloris sp.]
MKDSSATNAVMGAEEISALARGVRVVVGVLVLGLSYFLLRLTLKIESAEALYRDLLGEKDLPLMTQGLIGGREMLLALALFWPVATCLVLALVPRHDRALYVTAGFMLGILVQFNLTWTGLTAPFIAIISQLTGG